MARAGQAASWQRAARYRVGVWAIVAMFSFAAVMAAALIGWIVGQGLGSCTDPSCVSPPLSPPLAEAQPYTSATFGYSLNAANRCPEVMAETSRSDGAIDWTASFKGEWPVEVRGQPAAGQSAQQIVDAIQVAKYSDAQFAYSIPMAEIGYALGYGAVYDVRIGAGNADPIHARAVVIAAVKGDLAIVLDSLGPWDNEQKGHPNPAQTKIVICFSPIVNSVAWPGEPPP